MRTSAAFLCVLATQLAGCVGDSASEAVRVEPTSPSPEAALNETVDPGPYLLNLTWFLDASGRMGPSLPATGWMVLGGASDPSHVRDLVQFVAEPYPKHQRIVNVSVHLIFEAPNGWQQPQDYGIECWFGFDDQSYPVGGDAPMKYTIAAGQRLHVRYNLSLPPGGAWLPAGANPHFLCGIPGSQSPATPLHMLIGGDRGNASHIHPRSHNSTNFGGEYRKHHESGGTLVHGLAPAGPTASEPVRVVVPADAFGFRAWVRANQTQGADLDVEILSADRKFLAESNSPRAAEYVLFAPFNLAAAPPDYFVVVHSYGWPPTNYWLVVETLA